MAGTELEKNLGRGICLCLLMAVLAIPGAVQAADSMHYRTALFYYFQQDYFDALTELMKAQQLNAPGAFGDSAELLRGGASLSCGMEHDAEQIFEKLLAEPGASADRNRAWFYLGKLAWQKGALGRSAAALDKMAPTYHGELAPEANFLRASISLRQGNVALAASYDALLPSESPWLYYLYYNLGTTYAADGDWSAAVDYFERAAPSGLQTAEMHSLREQALTATGYAQLASKNFEQAVSAFAQVRLDSPLADRALLGYGWAYSGLADYRSAITPWKMLAERPMVNDSVRESLLSLPYAHERLGRQGTALEQYRHAGEVYGAELARVRFAIETFRDTDLSRQLDLDDAVSKNWLKAEDVFPWREQQPYLRHLMTGNAFQLAMRELADLRSTAQYLAEASQRLERLARTDLSRLQREVAAIRDDRSKPSPGVSGSASRIRDLQERVQSQERQVQASLIAVRARVRDLAIAELEQEVEKLQRALGQSRLAVARIYEAGGREVRP